MVCYKIVTKRLAAGKAQAQDSVQTRFFERPYILLLLLLKLAGVTALLIWSVRLIRTGVERAYSVPLRRIMRRGGENRLTAAFAGFGAALMLQSSTVVAMLSAGFAASGVLSATAAFSVLLGADVGSAAVAGLLTARAGWLEPLLLLTGVTLFLRSETRQWKQTGRILVGVGLVFLSLDLIGQATAPLRDNEGVGAVMRYLGSDLATAFLLGAVFTWAIHSSVAAVLLFVTLASQGLMNAEAAAALTLGANFGGSIIAFYLSFGSIPVARRVVLGNLLLRGGGALIALLSLLAGILPLDLLGSTVSRQVIGLHLLFNTAVLVVGLPLVPLVSRLCLWILPDANQTQPPRVTALNEMLLDRPEQALTAAAREVLRMGEAVEAMLAPAMGLYAAWDDGVAEAVRAREAEVNTTNFDIKLYLAKVRQTRELTPELAQRATELAQFAVSFEAAGDLVEKNLLAMARRMHLRHLTFSAAGAQELADFHDRVLASVQLALNVMMSGDLDAARQLAEEKDKVRGIEQRLHAAHLERLGRGAAETVDTSNIHQETIRVLKQINNAFAVVGHPILAETGELLPSRLAGFEDAN